MKNIINEKKYLILLILLAGILLSVPSLIRFINHNNYVINSEAYNNMRLYTQGDNKYDHLQAHSIPINVLNLVKMDGLGKQIIFKIIPIILGLATIIITYLLLRKQNISEKTILTIITLIIVSPIFIYVFSDYKIYSFIVFLNVLGIYFLMHDNIMVSSAAFAIIPFIDIFSGILTLAFVLIYMFSNNKDNTNNRIIAGVLLVAIIISIILNVYYGNTLTHLFRFNIHNILTDIGANIGISFSIIILTVIGLILLWENGLQTLVTYLLLLIAMGIALFNDTTRIYINFIIMIYAGFAFVYMNKRKWSIAIIKKTTILLIICSIFFSTLVYTTKLVRSEPTSEYVDALAFIKEQSLPTELILSSPSNGYFMEYYSERSAFIDDSTQYYDEKRLETLEVLAVSRNLERTEKILQEYNIKYILVDAKFELYLKEKEGLLFLIETSKKFTSIYKNNAVEVWMYNS